MLYLLLILASVIVLLIILRLISGSGRDLLLRQPAKRRFPTTEEIEHQRAVRAWLESEDDEEPPVDSDA